VIASGGLSHTKIDEQLDERFIRALQHNDTADMSAIPASVLVEGTSEIRNWIVTAAAANCSGTNGRLLPALSHPHRCRFAPWALAYWQLN